MADITNKPPQNLTQEQLAETLQKLGAALPATPAGPTAPQAEESVEAPAPVKKTRKRRKRAEKEKSEPMSQTEKEKADSEHRMFDYGDMIRGHVRQEVKINENIIAVFQTLNGKEDMWLRKMSGSFTGESVDYVATWFRSAELALGLVAVAINGEALELQDVLYDGDDPKEDTLQARMDDLLAVLPNVLVTKLQLHFSWFVERVADEFSGGALKNG